MHGAGAGHASVVAVIDAGGETFRAASYATTVKRQDAPQVSPPTEMLVSAVRATGVPSRETR